MAEKPFSFLDRIPSSAEAPQGDPAESFSFINKIDGAQPAESSEPAQTGQAGIFSFIDRISEQAEEQAGQFGFIDRISSQAPEEAGITSTPSGQLAVPLAAPAPPVPTPEQVRSQMAMQPTGQKIDEKPLKDIAKKTWATAAQEAYDDNVMRLLPFVGTAMGLYDSYKLFKASNALKNNTATPEQKKFLDDFVAKEAERQGGDKTLGYKATEILLRLPGFALEFAGTGGIAKGVAAGTRKVLGESAKFTARKTAIEAARNQIAKGATKEVTEGLVGQLGREVLKKPGEFIPTKVTEGIGRYTAERLAPSLALAANPLTPQGWRTISGTMDRMAPELGITQDQMGRAKAVIVGDGDDFWEAMAKAYGSEVVSDFTERLGDLADPLIAVFGKNIGAPLRAAFAKRWIGGVRGRSWQLFQNALDKYGWNGVLSEMTEERYADILQPAVESIGDETYAENFKMPSLEDLAAEAVALSVIPTIGLINSARKDRQIQMANAAEVNELTSVDSQQLVGQFSTPEYKQSIQDRFNAEKDTEIGLVGGKKEKLFAGAEVMDVDAELSGFDKAMAQFVRLYAKQVMGQDVIFLKNWREDYNGYRMRDSGNIYLAADRPGAWMVSTLGHEWKHQMDKNEEFAKANVEVRSLAESDAETSKRVNEILQGISKTYLNNADINDQAVRDQAWNEFTPLILETLMSEQNFQEKILTANPTAFQTIIKVVKEIFEKFGEIIDRMSPGTFTRAQWENTFRNSAGGFAKVEDIYTNAVKSYIQRTMSTGAPMSPEMKAAATEVMDSEAAPAEKGEAAKRPREILQEASVLARKEISDLIKSGKTPTNEEQSKILDKYISQVKEEDKKSVVTATEEALPKAMEEISRIEAEGRQLSEQEEQAIIDRYVKEARGEAPAAEPTGPVVATATTPTALPMPTQRAPIKTVAAQKAPAEKVDGIAERRRNFLARMDAGRARPASISGELLKLAQENKIQRLASTTVGDVINELRKIEEGTAVREEPQRAPPPGSPLESYYPFVMDRAMTEINSRAGENLADNQKAMILDRYAREAQLANENPASGIVGSFDPANKTAFETEVTKLEGIVAASGVQGLDPYIRSIRNSDTIEEVREAVKDFGERYRISSGLPAQAGEAAKVWHGTKALWAAEPGFPNGRIRLDKIGTGAGGQAYGWGWYSAEDKKVGEEYVPFKLFFNGREISDDEWDNMPPSNMKLAMTAFGSARGDYDKAIEELDTGFYSTLGDRFNKSFRQAAIAWLKSNADLLEYDVGDGSLYTLDIPDDVIPKLLDWDAPMSDQPDAMRRLEAAGLIEKSTQVNGWYVVTGGIDLGKLKDYAEAWDPSSFTGEKILRSLEEIVVGGRQGEKAARLLARAGIPGLKYFDAFSRDKSENQTRNYVIWDQDVLDRVALLERNGKKLDAIVNEQAAPQEPGEASKQSMDDALREFRTEYAAMVRSKGFIARLSSKFTKDPVVAMTQIYKFAIAQQPPDNASASTLFQVMQIADADAWDKLPVETRGVATMLSPLASESLSGYGYAPGRRTYGYDDIFGQTQEEQAHSVDTVNYAVALLNRLFVTQHKSALDLVKYELGTDNRSYVDLGYTQAHLSRYTSPMEAGLTRVHEATHVVHGRKYLLDKAYRKEADEISRASYEALDPELKTAVSLMEYIYTNRTALDSGRQPYEGFDMAMDAVYSYLSAAKYKGGKFSKLEVRELLYAHVFAKTSGAELYPMAMNSFYTQKHLASIPYKGTGAKPSESLLDRILSLIKRLLKISEKDTLLDAAFNLVMRVPASSAFIPHSALNSDEIPYKDARIRFMQGQYDTSKYSQDFNTSVDYINRLMSAGSGSPIKPIYAPSDYPGDASRKIDETANIISGASYIAALRARLKAKMVAVEPAEKKAAKVPEPKVKEPLPEEPKSLYLKADKSGVQMLTQQQADERQADAADVQETTITRVVFDTKSKRWVPQETIKGRFVTNMAEKDWVMYEDSEGKPTTKKYPKSIWVTPDMLPQSVPARDYGSYATLVSKDGTRRVNVKIASMTDKDWVVINGVEGSGVRKDKSGKDVAIPWTQLARYSKAEYPTVEDQKPITFVAKEIDPKSGVRNRVTLKNSVYWSHRGRSGWSGFKEDGTRMNVDSERYDIADAPQKPSYVLTEQDGEYANIVFTRYLARALTIARKQFNWNDSILEAGIAEATKRFKDLLYRAQVTESYGNATFEQEMRDFAKNTNTPERITTRFSWDKQMSALLSALRLAESRGDFAAAKLIGADMAKIKESMPKKWDEVDPVDAADISSASGLARLYIASRAARVIIGGVVDGGKRAGGILSTDAPSSISEERTRGDEISSEGPKLSDEYTMKGKPRSDYDRDPFIESVIDKILGAKYDAKKEPAKEQIANETGVPPAQVEEIKKAVDTTGFKPIQLKLIDVLGLRKGIDIFENGEATVLNELEKSEPGLIDRLGEETILKEITLTQMLLDTQPGEASRSLFGEAARMGQLREKFPDQAKELDDLISDKYTDKLLFGQAMEFLGDIGPAGLDAAYSKYMRNITRKVNVRGVSTMDAVDKIAGRILIEALFSRGQENDVKRGSNIVLKLMRSASASSAALRKSGLDWNEYESGMVYVLMSEYLGEAATKAGVVKKWVGGLGKTKAEMMAMSYAINYVRRRMNKSLSEMTAAEEGDLTNAANNIVKSISSYLPTAPETIKLPSGEVVDNPEYRIQLGTYLGALSSSTASLGDKALEIWKAGLLSGIGTMFIQNPLSNWANGFYEFGIKRPLEILLSNLPEGFLGTPSRGEGDLDARSGELGRAWKAMWKAQSSAAKIAWTSFRSEIPYYGVQQGGGPGVIGASGIEISDRYYSLGGWQGRVVRLPYRFLTMADDFFKHLFVVGHATSYAYREALDMGKTGADIDAHIEAQLKNPKSDSMKKGLGLAFDLVFQKRLGRVGQAITGVRQAAPIGLGFILPFVTTPLNILKQGLRRTPLGTPLLLYRTAKAYYMRKRTPPGKPDYTRENFISHLSEQALAWATTGIIASMIGGDGDEDEPRVQITGGRPLYGKDAGKQQAFERDQGPPSMSIKFGDGPWISYSKIEPLATFLAPIVNAIEAMNKAKNGDEWDAAASEAYSKTVDALTDKTFVGAFSDIVRAGENPKDITRWAGSFASSWVPSIIRQGLKASTPSESDLSIKGKPLSPEWFDSFGEMVKEQAAPGTTGQVRIDWLGREVRKSGPVVGPNTDVLYRLLTFAGIQVKGAEQDKLSRMITVWNQTSRFNAKENFEYYPSKPSKWITRKGERKFLNAEQYMEYQKLIGKMTQQFARSRRFNYDNPTLRDIEALEKIRADAVERAGNMIARKYRL